MANVEIATGYVTLVPTAKGIKKGIADELGGPELREAAGDAGDTAADEFGGRFGSAVPKAVAAAGIGLALTQGIGDALNREQVTDRIASSLALDPAEAETAGRVAGQLFGDAYGESIEDVADQLTGTIRTFGVDLSDAELYGLTAGAIDITSAFDVDAERVAQTTGLVLRSGLADNATEAQDIVTAALQNISAPAGDVLDTLYEFNEPLASLGLTGGAAIGVLSQAAEAGVFDLTKAGDAIKEFSIRAVDGSKTTSDAYATLGLDADATAAAIAAGGPAAQQAFGQVLTALDGIADPLEREAAGVALFGTTWEDLGPAAISALNPINSTIGDVTGATADLGDTLNDNLAVRLESIKRKGFDLLVRVITVAVIPAIEAVVDGVARFAQFLRNNTPIAYGFAAAIGVVAVAYLASLVPALIATATAAFTAAAGLIAANAPLIAITVAIGALVAGLVWAYQNVEIFRVAVDAVAAFIVETLWPAIQTVADVLIGALVPALSTVAGWVGVVIGWVADLAVDVTRHIGTVIGWFVDLAVDVARHIGTVIGWVADVIGWVADFAGTVTEKIGTVIGWFIDLGSTVDDIVGDIIGFLGDLVDTVTGLPGRIADAATGLFDGITDAARTAFNAVARLWNQSVGSIGFTVPDWVPLVGGNSWSVPNIPILHDGGIVPGRPGDQVVALLEAGERVIAADTVDAATKPAMNVTAYVSDGRQFIDLLDRRARLTA